MTTKSDEIGVENKLQDTSSTGFNAPPQRQDPRWILVYMLIFLLGLGSGYFIRGRNLQEAIKSGSPSQGSYSVGLVEPVAESGTNVRLPESYELPVSFSDLGPQLIASGSIDYDRFLKVYENAGQPLSDSQKAVFKENVDASIVVDRDNAYFLLNFFWALGLVNQNPILTEGPMTRDGADQIGRYASTGGWTIGAKPPTELYASSMLVSLTPEQQARLDKVAQNVYRPCCNNPTHFPDCNHGMAMLGVLELLASQDVGEDDMFEAAKYLNAFWFPRQSYELAAYLQMERGLDFADIDAREAVSGKYFSSAGFQNIHQWLAANDGLEPSQGGGNSCGV
jgi:hypothetical protein